ncbi:MAG: hypothetical protein ACQET7_06540 [Thermodesulfobacteriota bacterium]
MSERRSNPTGAIEVDLFSEDVDGPDHPEAVRFHRLLEEVAKGYDCNLLRFEVQRGTVTFAFDDDVLTAEIIRELEMEYGT